MSRFLSSVVQSYKRNRIALLLICEGDLLAKRLAYATPSSARPIICVDYIKAWTVANPKFKTRITIRVVERVNVMAGFDSNVFVGEHIRYAVRLKHHAHPGCLDMNNDVARHSPRHQHS